VVKGRENTKTTEDSIRVEPTGHKDKRTNTPTRELRDFVREGEAAPEAMLYPRDATTDALGVRKPCSRLDS